MRIEDKTGKCDHGEWDRVEILSFLKVGYY